MAQGSKPLVLVLASGTVGDVLPLAKLALRLQARGWPVRMVVPAYHGPLVRTAGLPCQTLGTVEETQAVLDNPELWHERKGWGVLWRGAVPHLDAMREAVRALPAEQDCVVLSHPLMVPLAALARAARPGLRIVATYLAPSNFCSSHDMLSAGSLPIAPWVPQAWLRCLWRWVHKTWIDPVTLPSLNAARARQGLAPVDHFFAHMLGAPDASLGLFPAWFASAQVDWPQPYLAGRFVGSDLAEPPPLPEGLAQFLAAGPAPIVFTPGSGHQHAQAYFAAAAQALQRLGRRGVFITPHAGQLPMPLPQGIHWQAQAPFSRLFAGATAVVHHGGIGTTAEALRAGVPQLVVPFAYDQFDNARRAQRLGVAEVLLAKRLSARRMHRQLARLLGSPTVPAACQRWAQAMQQQRPMEDVLGGLEGLLLGPPATATMAAHEAAPCPP